ncbi:MAG: YIP1 family protein [Bacillota bacterium]
MSSATPVATGPAPGPRRSPWAMLLSVMTEPRATFEALRAKPLWWQPLLAFWLLTTIVGLAAVPKGIEAGLAAAQAQSPGVDIEAMRRTVTTIAYVSVPFSSLLTIAVGTLILAGVLALIGTMFGGEGSFMQIWSVTLYSSVPSSIFATLINAAMTMLTPAANVGRISTSLAAFLPSESVGSGLWYVLSAFDPFSIWSLVLLILGYALIMQYSVKKSAWINVPVWLVKYGITMGMVAIGLSRMG